jgi:ATP-dependent Clp protease ATP-binding subunit ClpA
VALAQEEARRLDHQRIGTEHLFLGILVEGESAAARALVMAGATVDAARDKVAEAVGRNGGPARSGDLPFTVRATRALDRASRLSLRRRDAEVETEHVLLSVLDVEGTAGQVLRRLGVDIPGLRRAVDLASVGGSVDLAADSETAAGGDRPRSDRSERSMPNCAVCHSSLDKTLAYRVLAARGEGGQSKNIVVVYCSACGAALTAVT